MQEPASWIDYGLFGATPKMDLGFASFAAVRGGSATWASLRPHEPAAGMDLRLPHGWCLGLEGVLEEDSCSYCD